MSRNEKFTLALDMGWGLVGAELYFDTFEEAAAEAHAILEEGVNLYVLDTGETRVYVAQEIRLGE